MRIISKKALVDYGVKVPTAKSELDAWYAEAKAADWATPVDVKAKYGNASILRDGRVVFNICGNKHRLVVWINYEFHTIYIRFLGTHEEYDNIDAQTI
jgi:mRNA interferase HigB